MRPPPSQPPHVSPNVKQLPRTRAFGRAGHVGLQGTQCCQLIATVLLLPHRQGAPINCLHATVPPGLTTWQLKPNPVCV